MITFGLARNAAADVDGDERRLQHVLVERLEPVEVVVVLLLARLPREVDVAHLRRDDGQVLFKVGVQDVRQHAAVGDGVDLHGETSTTTTTTTKFNYSFFYGWRDWVLIIFLGRGRRHLGPFQAVHSWIQGNKIPKIKEEDSEKKTTQRPNDGTLNDLTAVGGCWQRSNDAVVWCSSCASGRRFLSSRPSCARHPESRSKKKISKEPTEKKKQHGTHSATERPVAPTRTRIYRLVLDFYCSSTAKIPRICLGCFFPFPVRWNVWTTRCPTVLTGK